MRLSRIVLSGFKTFARHSEVHLDERVTAIVGPNGSGKSNLIDAVRWALGETNARELRGMRMDEVIYAGGGGRGRVGLADVELVLDNQDGRLGEGAEISVARRVVRAGDSEFRLNGERVRLRDLERVLGPTGLTQSGYAVVAQHDIDAIIQATPAQRRSLVEQAAGVRSLEAACEDARGRVTAAEATLRRLEDFLADASPRLAELSLQAERALQQRRLSDRLAELRGSLAREEWRAARARLKQARRRLDAATGRAQAVAEAGAGFSSGVEEQRRALADRRREQREAARRLEEARLAAERAAGEARRWGDRRDLGAVRRSQAGAQHAAAVAELERCRQAAAELGRSPAEPDPEPAAPAEDLERERARHAEAAERLAAVERRRAEAETELEAATTVRAAAVAGQREAISRLTVLEDAVAALDRDAHEARALIEVALAGGDDPRAAVAAAVAAGRLAGRRLRTCFEAITPGDAMAVEALLENRLDAWLVDDLDAAVRLLEPEGGREELVAHPTLDALPPPVFPGTAGPARAALAAIVISEPGAAAALHHHLGNAWLVPDAATAAAVVERTGGAAALPDGTVIGPASIRGGAPPGRDRALAAEPDRRRLAAVEASRRSRLAERESARRALGEVEAERARAERRFRIAHDELDDRRRASAGRRRDLEAAVAALRQAELEASRWRLLAEDRARRREAARQATAAAAARASAAELRLLAVEEEVLTALVRGRHAAASAHRAGDEVWSATGALESLAPALVDAERALAALESERAELAVAEARAADEVAAAGAEVAAAEVVVAHLAAAVRDDDGDEGPEPDAQEAERAEREIVRLERQAVALGPVNALAPEQRDGLTARVDAVRGNRDDLRDACADIRAMARGVGEESERRFEAVFGAVSTHFRDLFGELFPGGRAALRLEPAVPGPEPEPGAPAALPGVEILAQPPGKRLQPLSLLSGGERALTALAVILALQQVNPSPFYIFDEVDAALDDSNVVRFTRLLRRLAEHQQFIVVTHNHITMAAADALHGVTIDRDGVSSILSVRLAAGDGGSRDRIVAVPDARVEAAV